MTAYRLAPCWCPHCKKRFEGIINTNSLPRRHRTGLPAFVMTCTDCECNQSPKDTRTLIRQMHDRLVVEASKHARFSMELAIRERLGLPPWRPSKRS